MAEQRKIRYINRSLVVAIPKPIIELLKVDRTSSIEFIVNDKGEVIIKGICKK